jgi:hypothetical protein
MCGANYIGLASGIHLSHLGATPWLSRMTEPVAGLNGGDNNKNDLAFIPECDLTDVDSLPRDHLAVPAGTAPGVGDDLVIVARSTAGPPTSNSSVAHLSVASSNATQNPR